MLLMSWLSRIPQIPDRLERRWVISSYSGTLLLVLAVCLFGAATNSIAGWLYVISGISFALLIIAAVIPPRSLKKISVERVPLDPVSAGEDLTITLRLENLKKEAVGLLQIWDCLPVSLGDPRARSIEVIPPQEAFEWSYFYPTHQRGVHHWQTFELRTGAPLGLFWCRRTRQTQAVKAVIYPPILPLVECPILDALGSQENLKLQSDRRYLAATEGITKTLRPYRYGDPTRLIHWRSSARFDEFQVRELEIVTGGQEVVIALDSASTWNPEAFEMAVVAATALYFYAQRTQMMVKLWTAGQGLVSGNRQVLEVLAAVQFQEVSQSELPQPLPVLWLTAQESSLSQLNSCDRWLYFLEAERAFSPSHSHLPCPGRVIHTSQELVPQLQLAE